MSNIFSKKRYNRLLRVIAAYLANWRVEEELSIPEMVEETGIPHQKIMSALLAQDWKPSLKDFAKVEAATGKEIIVVNRNKDK